MRAKEQNHCTSMTTSCQEKQSVLSGSTYRLCSHVFVCDFANSDLDNALTTRRFQHVRVSWDQRGCSGRSHPRSRPRSATTVSSSELNTPLWEHIGSQVKFPRPILCCEDLTSCWLRRRARVNNHLERECAGEVVLCSVRNPTVPSCIARMRVR
jgi:hypothetical protein